MKRGIIVIMVLGMANCALGLNYLGPPTAHLRSGQWFLGGSYAESKQDMEFTDDADANTELKDFEQSVALGRFGVGLADNILEVYGLVGMMELEQGDHASFETDDELLLGGGFRATMYMGESNHLDWGITGQALYTKFDGDSVVLRTPTDYELSWLEFMVGIGPCWRPDPFVLYGGLMVHFITGDIDTAELGSYDIREQSTAGIYLGGGVDLEKHLMLTAEFQATPDSLGWGIAGSYQF